MRCVQVILENVLHTQSVCVRRMRNFLRASEVRVLDRNPYVLSLKPRQTLEYSVIICSCLAKTLTADALRKPFMRHAHTF